MALIVQKFGGSSVADTEKVLAAARNAIRAQQDGNQVVMVVSAMGKNTDQLEALAHEINQRPPAREMDMLLSTGEQVSVALMAMAIDSLGASGVSLTGAQIGIKTDASHTKARIRSISTDRIQQLLDAGNVVIAAGFQGIDENLNITTLGRGGSDTTAVALAAVLQADACEIYTDVDGVYTTDPRHLPAARCVRRISYDEMLELASLGAGVMYSRSIEFAKKYAVPIRVRNSFSDVPGTIISETPESMDHPVCGTTLTRDEALIAVSDVPDRPGTSLDIFSEVADQGVTIDMIVQNVGRQGRANISFTVPRDELGVTLDAVRRSVARMDDVRITHDDRVSKISVVGLGMANQSGVASRMFAALAIAGINLQMITTSEIKISALVDRDQAQESLSTVHRAFQLHDPPVTSVGSETARPRSPRRHFERGNVSEIVEHLRFADLEELFLDGIDLDTSQGRVTITGVPDTPGIAAKVFAKVAEADIFVDMIVQSYPHQEDATMSFTVPSDCLREAEQVARQAATEFACGAVSTQRQIAKLSVSGIGLRSHTGVAIRMFRALSKHGINVEMVNTSEARVNVVVAIEYGDRGLAAVQDAFADLMR
jgi:aspartate kinase